MDRPHSAVAVRYHGRHHCSRQRHGRDIRGQDLLAHAEKNMNVFFGVSDEALAKKVVAEPDALLHEQACAEWRSRHPYKDERLETKVERIAHALAHAQPAPSRPSGGEENRL